jgi:pyruvate,water dikinase
MGLALLDVADTIRPLTEVVAFLRTVDTGRSDLLEALGEVPGGPAAVAAIRAFLDDYGMRCVGEIDITRPRWHDRPGTLVPTILGNVDRFDVGAGGRRFEQGRQEALAKEQEVVARLRALAEEDPGPEHSAEEWRAEVDRRVDETRRAIGVLRSSIGGR